MGVKTDKKLLIITGLLIVLLSQIPGCIERDITGEAYGSFYTNDSGEPKGGWEYTQEYYANLTIDKGIGRLVLEVKPGLGDYLKKHEFFIILNEVNSEEMELLISGQKVVLEWVENDEVWGNKWDDHYIASFGVNMQEDEILGNIKPGLFPGLMDHYYVELRLPEIS